jgi:fatty-acyl-CoA synthase
LIKAKFRKFLIYGDIPPWAYPRYLRFVDEFPMTITGKVQKFLIRARMIEELGLAAQAPGGTPSAAG